MNSELEELIRRKRGGDLEVENSAPVNQEVVKEVKKESIFDKLKKVNSKRRLQPRSFRFTEKELVLFQEYENVFGVKFDNDAMLKMVSNMMIAELLALEDKKVEKSLKAIKIKIYENT